LGKLFLTAMIIAFIFGNVIAEEQVVEPTAFESFVTRASVVVEVDEPVGWIVSTDSTQAIALPVARSARNSRRRNLRARLRADLANSNAGQGRMHADGAEVEAATEDVAGVEDAVSARKAEAGASWRVQGTGSCRRPARPMRIRCPSYGVEPDGSGLWLSAYGGTGFSFPGHRPAELATLLKQAAGALRAL
jgi:hypothetical protein